MCELLYMKALIQNPDPAIDSKWLKPGMVIDIYDDGTVARYPLVINNPDWGVFTIKGVARDDPSVTSLLVSEEVQRKTDNPNDPLASDLVNPVLQIRAFKIDLTSPALLSAVSKVGTVVAVSPTDIANAVVRLAALAQPSVIA